MDNEQLTMEMDVVEHEDGTVTDGMGQLLMPFMAKHKRATRAQCLKEMGINFKIGSGVVAKLMNFKEGLKGT